MSTLTKNKKPNAFVRLTKHSEFTIGLVVIALFLLATFLTKNFFGSYNLKNLTKQGAIVGVLAVAQTFIIITSGIDISGGAIAGLGCMTMAMIMNGKGTSMLGIAILANFVVCTLCGFLNGVIIFDLKVPAMIATLGTQTIFRGILKLLCNGNSISFFEPDGATFVKLFDTIGNYDIFGVLPVLACIWIVTWRAAYPGCDSILILNLSAAIKILLALTVGVLGIVYVSKNGFVNSMEARTFLPSFDLNSLSYISVILFNFLGFEVVCTYADNMQEPRRQIPQAIVTGGIVIAAIYLFSAFGIGAAVPVRDISPDSGLIDAVSLMTGGAGGTLVRVVALLFLVTLFGNMISWSMGVNSTAAYAADRGDMPAVFARRWKRNDMPVGSAVTSGIVASAVCLLGAVMERLSPDSSLFWSFFALNLVMLLLSYLPVFPAFLALRQRFPDAERPFRVPGGGGFLKCLAYVPMALIALSIVFTAVPLSTDRETLATILPITVGSIISVLLGELLIAVRRRHHPISGG